ncbi:hypothetical protein P7K49_031819 [Saguinus oedipus]|uniref:Uncharacterized protein n=1 Tax=Saguinus oedipus TaxID=9490 RepID=A0ABQ9U2E5_SAGOE|nr:hypothetical protein P7K49_031819 [Saguinus oedipus]
MQPPLQAYFLLLAAINMPDSPQLLQMRLSPYTLIPFSHLSIGVHLIPSRSTCLPVLFISLLTMKHTRHKASPTLIFRECELHDTRYLEVVDTCFVTEFMANLKFLRRKLVRRSNMYHAKLTDKEREMILCYRKSMRSQN